MLCFAAARLLSKEEARKILVEVFDDMPGHAAGGLRTVGGADELAFLKSQEPHETRWVRKAIASAIRGIEKRLEKERNRISLSIKALTVQPKRRPARKGRRGPEGRGGDRQQGERADRRRKQPGPPRQEKRPPPREEKLKTLDDLLKRFGHPHKPKLKE